MWIAAHQSTSNLSNLKYCDSTGAVFLSGWGFEGRAVAATVVVGSVLSNVAFTAQHCRLCWSDVQCESDPGMYSYLIVFNRLVH